MSYYPEFDEDDDPFVDEDFDSIDDLEIPVPVRVMSDESGGVCHMNGTIRVQIRSVYGNETVYPACPMAVGFARIAGTKTLTMATLEAIRAMGVSVEVEVPTITILD